MGQELGRISGVMLKENLEINSPSLAVDTDLLYIDADNNSIGINSTATDSQTSLIVNSAIQTGDLIVDTELKLPNLRIKTNTNTISSVSGNLYLDSASSIISANIRTDDLNLNDNVISSTSSNQSIELRPAGAVEIPTNLNVDGDLHATGDILIEGTVVFGDTDDLVTETVQIKAEVNSDLVPLGNEVWSLGSDPNTGGAEWLNTYIYLLNGQDISATSVQANGVDLTLRQGNTWYVSKNGNDTNYGNHEASTFLTIKHALENASMLSGDTIIIYPGTYEEITPLVVPQGVSIRGMSLRSVTITADPTTISNNVFELNGETTVNDVTVTNFRYDAVNDTGYAFSFANNFKVTSRSPYVQNVSVITSGSVTTLSDPRGFASGDAGKGALVDGAKALSTSVEASMLFHSCTFITPGVNGLTMRNGVRVEWLNSFVYFANIAMYATSGTGRYDALRDITRYGAEVRSIGSACVYGNYGAWAEGPGTLMYLINHNFSYISAGKNSTNDPSTHNPDNEVTMLDTGDIHYQSFDNDGHFHIGRPFSVSYNTGAVSFDGVSLTATGVSSILFGSPTSNTAVDAGLISTGNIKFNGNTISSLAGDVNLAAGTDLINLSFNVSAKKNISIDNDFSLKGVLTLGNDVVDIAEFKAPTNTDILPSADRLYGLGVDYVITGLGPEVLVPGQRWNKIINQLTVIDNNIQLFDNVIQTTQSNSNLELRTHGAGQILLENNALTITNQLTVNGDTSTQSISVLGNIDQTGNILQLGDRSVSNGIDLTGNISATVEAQLETITISQGLITTTASNADLELRAAGTGQVVFPTSSVLIQNNLTVNGTMTAGDAVIAGDVVAATFNNADITVTANQITTINSNSNLELRAHGTGEVIAPLADVEITQDLTIDALSTLTNLITVGDKVHIGNLVQTGTSAQTGNYQLSKNLTVTENAYFTDIEIVNNNISTRSSNSDFEFTAAGTGQLIVPTSDVLIENNLTVNGLMTANNAIITNDIVAPQFDITDISFYANTIITRGADQDLILGAHSNGLVISETSDVLITQNLQVDGLSTIGNAVIVGDMDHTGLYALTGDVTQTGNYSLSNNLTVSLGAQFANIGIENNVITTTDSNSDLELRASGTGLVKVDDNFRIETTLNIIGITATNGLTNSGTITSDKFSDGNILISDNYITTTTGDLTLVPNNNGLVSVAADNVLIDNNLQVEGTSTLGNTVVGKTLTTQVNQNLSGTSGPTGFFYYGWQILNPGQTVPTFSVIQPGWTVVGQPTWVVSVVGDGISNYDITITGGSFASGGTYSFTGPDPAILSVTGTINRTGSTTETGNYNLSNNLTVTGSATLANIDIVNNVITTSDSNSDLELRAAPGNRIYAGANNVAITNNLRVNGTTTTSTINNSGVVFSDEFRTTDLIISQNYITSQPNTNIKLIAAGSGNVVLPKITFDANAIKATALNNNIELTVSSGSVTIPTTNALKIPVGTTANKAANTVGDIRLDTTDTLFTGWNGARVTFGGLFSTDRRTTVLAHPTNNSINFVTNTNANMSLTESGLTVNALLINSDLQITGTTISSTVPGSNITLTPNNNGYLELGNIRINANNIQNANTSSNIILENTGSGYVKFGGTGGIVIPSGNELSRPTLPETGDFRFNTNLSTAEVFNGIEYVSLSGTSNALLTAEEIAEITNLWGLVLG